MDDPNVKSDRGQRVGRADATRRRIVDAATARFVERGYRATTLADIAADADVAVQTVYFHFGNKRTVLKSAVDIAAAGDDEPVPLLERSWMEEIRAEAAPTRIVALWTSSGRDIFVRIGAIMRVVREASATDREMADQWNENEQQRLVAFRALGEVLHERDALATGLSVDEATDIVFALNSLEVYHLLTAVRGWTPERWESWLRTTLCAVLLR